MSGQIRDLRMIAKAVEQRWPSKPEWREAILKKMVADALDPTNKPRERATAAKVVMMAESQNQADQHHESGSKLEISAPVAVVNAKETATLAMELVRKEPEYLAYLEQRAIEQDRQRQIEDRTIDVRPRTE